jgi:hypothetical protein
MLVRPAVECEELLTVELEQYGQYAALGSRPDPPVVTLTIRSEPDGCVATIVHELDAKWVEYVSRTEAGWTRILRSIDDLMA